MKKIFRIYIALIVGVFSTSCSTDFLDTTPSDKISDVSVFSDPNLTETFVNGIYCSITHPMAGYNGILKAEYVDEAHDMWYQFSEFNKCMLTPDNLQTWWFENWDALYSNIRKCNMFFANFREDIFGNTEVDGVLWKDRLKGEVHFLRAFFYHQLVSLYGGVPIITKVYKLDDNFSIARDSYANCIDFIVAECDSAASLLPETNTGNNKGRITKGAALALKSEVLLYAASELHNNNSLFSNFSNPELLGYTSGDSKSRWEKAQDAAKAVIDLGLYSLYKANPASTDSIAENYAEIFIADETEEDLFVKYFLSKDGGIANVTDAGNNLPLVAGPNGYHLYGEDTPIGNLVDDYEMIDGSYFDWNNPVHAADPYKNRDPRFYASILYEGEKYKERPEDVQPLDPNGVIQVGTWETWNAQMNQMVEVYGLDSRNSSIEPFNAGYTGYYLRKLIDPSVNAQYSGQSAPWRFLRYTEIILNYAEACIELGEDPEACYYINMIRKRAGMPDINESGVALRDRYRHERRIELAFEDKRFYDVRRWLIGTEGYTDAKGVDVRYKLNADHTTALKPTITPKVIQTRYWDNKAYFFPISREEMNKNNLLIQNPNY